MEDCVRVFETDRVYARHWRLEDAAAAFEIYGDPVVTRHIGGNAEPDLAATEKKLQFLIERNGKLVQGMGSFPVLCKSSDQLLGNAMIKPLPDVEGNFTEDIEIGWHLRRSVWGQGYATEFGRKLLSIGFDELNLAVLYAVVDIENPASARVAGRLGMSYLGRTTQYYKGDEILKFSISSDHYHQNQA